MGPEVPSDPLDLRELAAGLLAEVRTLNARIESFDKTLGRSRQVIRFLAISLVFDILLSLGLGYVANRALNASRDATRATASATAATVANAATIKANCLAANESRALNLEMWENLVKLVPARDPQSQATLDDIVALARRTFVARDCG